MPKKHSFSTLITLHKGIIHKQVERAIRFVIVASFLLQLIVPLEASASQDVSPLENISSKWLEQSESSQAVDGTTVVDDAVAPTNGDAAEQTNHLFMPLVTLSGQEGVDVSTERPGVDEYVDESKAEQSEANEAQTDDADASEVDQVKEIQAANTGDTSPYGLGTGMSASGAILPSITNFSSDLFSGSANINIPIEAPSGLGGMNPNISLSYSSASVNAIRSSAGQNEHKIQAGLPGYGWSIGGLSYIVVGARQTSMVLNGTSVRIDKDGNTSPHIFAKVQRNVVQDEDAGYDPLEQNRGEWIVTTTDGTKYIFGSPPEQQIFTLDANVEKLAIETLIDWDNQSGRTRRKVVKYLLREVIDLHGNRMEYEYQAETGAVGGCVNEGSSGRWASQRWYHRTTRPTKITWSANGENDTGKMSMLFGYDNRADINSSGDDSWIDDGDCNQHQHSKKKLKDITVNVTVGTTERTLSKYVLENNAYYPASGNEKHLQLNAITKYGKGGTGEELFSQSFAYSTKHTNRNGVSDTDDGFNGLRLTEATHSWGGSTEYIYKEIPVSQCTRRIDHPDWSTCTRSDDDDAQLVNFHYRYLVTRKNIADGVTNGNVSSTSYEYFGGLERIDVRGGLESLGHSKIAVTVKDAANTEVKYEVHEFHQRTQGQSELAAIRIPHPTLGKPSRVTLYQAPQLAMSNGICPAGTLVSGRCEMSKTENVWEAKKPTDDNPFWGAAAAYADHPRWIRLKESKVTQGGVNNETKYSYESSRQNNTQFGNITKTEEYADGVRQRVSYTLYYPNSDTHIVNRPARMRVYAGDNATCLSETRNIYDSTGNTYKHEPATGLVYRTETLLNGDCTPTEAIWTYDANWAISHFDYDDYGNQTVATNVGPNSSGNQNLKTETTYDSFYNLFPIETKNVQETTFVETAQFYGVNRSINSNGAYWGAMAEFCGVNNICTRQKYDGFGRSTYRWDSVPKANGWASDSNANVKYIYNAPDTDDDNDDSDDDNGDGLSGLQTYIVTEWHSPRCYGNFVRHHYNGLGQLIHEQSPKQDWRTNMDGCNPGENKPEVDVDYGYDALGNQIYAGVPRTASGDKASPSRRIAEDGWPSAIKTTSYYDALGRPTKVIAPNGERTEYIYSGRETKVVAKDASGTAATAKMVKWTETDGLGNLRNVYTGKKSNGRWVTDAQVTLTHNAVGNLESVTNAAGGTATMAYNKAGQKISMTDPDLGSWSYVYDRLGRLTRQTDARDQSTCLYYQNTTARLLGKQFRPNTNCPATLNAYDIKYTYDGNGGTSKGQLTQVYKSSGYTKDISYNDQGLLQKESIKIPGNGTTFDTQYVYEPINFRLKTTTYPDGDILYHSYNSMGLPAKLVSNKHGTLVDGTTDVGSINNAVEYDEAGRLRAMQLRAGGSLWRTQEYYDWNGPGSNGNGRLSNIKIGTSNGATNRLHLKYGYDEFSNVTSIGEKYNNSGNVNTPNQFTYNSQNRLDTAYVGTTDERRYTWQPSGNIKTFEGSGTYSYGTNNAGGNANDAGPHAVTWIDGQNYKYDDNGNMTSRNGQTLTWNHENRLEKVERSGSIIEQYLYDDGGQRIKKWDNSSETYYVNAFYEEVIADTPLGDVNCDGRTDVVDALGIMQHEVKMRIDFGQCPLGSSATQLNTAIGDVNQDGRTNVVDALFIMQCEVALSNSFCPGLVTSASAAEPDPTVLSLLSLAQEMAAAKSADEASANRGGDVTSASVVQATYKERLAQISLPLTNTVQAAQVETNQAMVATTTVTKYYYFNGQRIAMSRNDVLSYLHGDHLGSTALSTDRNGDVIEDQKYYPFGSQRDSGPVGTDHQYTGQKLDGTGLMYYNARYYDPQIGQFISPDTIVPDPSNVSDYNRYMYVRGNPMGYTDETGHVANWVIGAGLGGLVGGALYGINEVRNGDGLDLGDWKDMSVAVGSGAVAGALIATPGGQGAGLAMLQASGVSMGTSLVAQHGVNLTVGVDFDASDHIIEGGVALLTPTAAKGAGKLVTMIPKISRAGTIGRMTAQYAGQGLMDGTMKSAGAALKNWQNGEGLPTSGNITGEYVKGMVSTLLGAGTGKLAGYHVQNMSQTAQNVVGTSFSMSHNTVGEWMVGLNSWAWENPTGPPQQGTDTAP